MTQGMSYYFTGIPCKNGHIARRYIKSAVCFECSKEHEQKPECKMKRAAYQKTKIPKEKSRINAAIYHKKNRDLCLEKMRVNNPIYYQKNKERIKKQTLKYQADNAAARTDYKKRWRKARAKIDPVFKMALVCRRMLHRALGVSGQKKYKRTQDYLPYTYSQLVDSLESQFKAGMSWDNYGDWHIDHKTPLAHFIKIGITDPAIINTLDNLQPLWAKDNMAKGSTIKEIDHARKIKS